MIFLPLRATKEPDSSFPQDVFCEIEKSAPFPHKFLLASLLYIDSINHNFQYPFDRDEAKNRERKSRFLLAAEYVINLINVDFPLTTQVQRK